MKDGIYKVMEHYEIYVSGVFMCSSDNRREALDDYFEYTGIKL